MKKLEKMTPHEIEMEILRLHYKQQKNYINFTTEDTLTKKIEINDQINKTNDDFYNALDKLIKLAYK